jgi:hypothetical protein
VTFNATVLALVAACLTVVAAQAQPRHPIADARQVAPPPQQTHPIYQPPPGLHQQTLPPPIDLTSTTDEPTCSQHGGLGAGLACKAVFPLGQLVLVWSWPGHTPLTGYRVYRVDGGQRTLVGSQTQGDGKAPYTIFIFQTVPTGGYAGECFAATAYSGGVESPLSAQFCVGGRSVVQVATLPASHMRSLTLVRTITQQTAAGCSMCVSGDTTTIINENTQATALPHVGYDPNLGSVARTGVYFDLTPYMYKTIKSARLNMSVQISATNATSTDGSDLTDHYTSCIAQIGVGMDQWWTFNDWFDVSVVQTNVQQMGPEVSFDVTPIVQQWASGTTNNGFVLMGAADAPGVNFQNFASGTDCLTIYRADDVQLVVEYD